MATNGTIVARKTADDLLLNEDATRFTCAWEDLRSTDNQQIRVEWSAQVVCVDSAADRALLTERFFSASDSREITPMHISRFFTDDVGAAVRRFVLTLDSLPLVDGTSDVALSELLAEQCRKSAFAVGMAVLPPYTLRIASPSLERQQQLTQVQQRLEAIAQTQSNRTATLTELTRRLGAHDGNVKVLDDLNLSDPLDLYRAASIADPAWAAATPSLQIASGVGVLSLNPTRPLLVGKPPAASSDVGPLRSIRSCAFAGSTALIVGARDGVCVLRPDSLERLATFRYASSNDFGFNSVGVLEESRAVVATHSEYGAVRWPQGGGEPTIISSGACRSFTALSSRVAVFASVNALHWLRAGKDVEVGLTGTSMIVEIAELPDKLLAIAYADRTIAIIDANAGPTAEPLARVRMLAPIVSVCGLDVCGLPRVVAAMSDGTLRVIDPYTSEVLRIGPEQYPARVVRSRPGWIALLNVDRTRVALVDLAQPDRLASELHLTAATSNRGADLWFA